MPARPWRPASGGLTLDIRATPRGGRDRIDGLTRDGDRGPALAVRVSAAPEGGRANAAIEALLAQALGVPKSAVSVAKGATGRRKRVEIRGDAQALAEALEALAARA
jgi:uncharacterized protein YggU (UPF0235/DUF167 family)